MSIPRYKPKNSVAKFDPSIPEKIRPLIMERNVLSGENPEGYDELLNTLVVYYQPGSDILRWLEIKRLCDTIVEELRYSRIKGGLIEIARKPALVALLRAIENTSVVNVADEAEASANAWFTDPDKRKQLDELLRQFNLSIDAKAFALCAPQLQALVNMQIANDSRYYQVRWMLDQQHNINSLTLTDTESEKPSE